MKDETIIKNEWIKHFKLTALSNSKFYKIVGCFMIGFELFKIPHRGLIQPYFVLYPLWRENIKKCFWGPYIQLETKNEKGLCDKVTLAELLTRKDAIFRECEECMKFDILDDIHSNEILDMVNEYHNFSNNSKNPRIQSGLCTLRIYMATYLNDKELLNKEVILMDEMYNRITHDVFESIYGDYDKWKENLLSVFSNRQAVLDKIEENIANSKIKERVELLP